MKRIFLLLIISCQIFGSDKENDSNYLKKRLEHAQKGDYIVAEAGKMITLIALRSRTESSIIFEEISVPAQHFKEKRPQSWAEWVKNQAPGHSSWSMIEIDLTSNQILECYSFSRASWLQLATQDSFLSTLLRLPLQQITKHQRKKIGPAPNTDEVDHRKIWQPPLIINGQQIEQPHFDAYAAEWPKDHSELSGQTVTLYFNEESKFPLPYWIQIDTTHAAVSMRVIDSGSHLASPYHKLPRRVPEFLTPPRMTDKGLELALKSPKYYKTFELFAIDITTKEKHIVPLAHKVTSVQEETVSLEVPEIELAQMLEPGHRYTWLLVPTGYSEYYTEFTKPFSWNP
ncbi:MAG: hypothetical protein K2X08_05500 [Chlamydiales bacterium]|nr:hypothetical protein [Chlamydiales bacterium]